MKTYLLLPQIHIHNANALSSSYTIGFPAMTAWLGAVHAMERQVQKKAGLSDIRFPAAAVSCSHYSLQVYRGPGDYVNSVIATANPLKKKGKNFERPPFIEEPRIHLTVSLLISCSGVNGDNEEKLLQEVEKLLHTMKMASGDIISAGKSCIFYVSDEDEQMERKILRRLMPGFVIIERRDLLRDTGEMTSMEKLLSVLAVHHHSQSGEDGLSQWSSEKEAPGWLVPLAVGFHGISPLGQAAGQRDPAEPHCFAECAVTLGEWILPIRAESIKDLLWTYSYDKNHSMYVCVNQ